MVQSFGFLVLKNTNRVSGENKVCGEWHKLFISPQPLL